jgi:hypothetical protein
MPVAKATSRRRRGTRRSATITQAPTYVSVSSTEPAVRLMTANVHPCTTASSAPNAPIGTPSASEAQKRRP